MPVLDRSLRFGSHLFVNPEDTPATLRPALDALAHAGFTLVRVFMPWSQLEPFEGVYRWSPYDELFDDAQVRGIKIIVTLMGVSPPGWMKLTHGLQEAANLDDAVFWARGLDHVRRVVERYRNHPALDSWILWNEPCRRLDPRQPETLAAFRAHLERAYAGDAAAYNAAHFRPASGFAEIEEPRLAAEGFLSHRAKVEWLEFSTENLMAKIGDLAAAVRGLDAEHPIHVNPHRVSQCLADEGQSVWREADLVDFVGCSAHPAWHSVRFARERYGDSIALFADLMRSATRAKDNYFWVTELQGGPTLMSAFEPLLASPEEARLWLWQGVAAGAKAVVYWCAHGRTDGYEAGEWDLLDLRGRPTPQLDAICATIVAMAPYRAELDGARPPVRSDVGIVISEEAMRLDLVDGSGDDAGNPRNRQKTADAVAGAYLLAADLSLEVAFYDQDRLMETPVDALPPVLILPGLVVVDDRAVAFLMKVVRSGRLVVGDGFFAWKDRHGRLASSQWDAADRLWGAVCAGYEPCAGDDAGGFGAWLMRARLAPTDGVETGARWRDGQPAVTVRREGKGAACRAGTAVFQAYFTEPTARVREWFARLIEGRLADAPRLERPVAGVRLRRLESGTETLAILINSGAADAEAGLRTATGRRIVRVPAKDAVVVRA